MLTFFKFLAKGNKKSESVGAFITCMCHNFVRKPLCYVYNDWQYTDAMNLYKMEEFATDESKTNSAQEHSIWTCWFTVSLGIIGNTSRTITNFLVVIAAMGPIKAIKLQK